MLVYSIIPISILLILLFLDLLWAWINESIPLCLKLYRCQKARRGHNSFREILDLQADELADLYSVEQLRSVYSNCLKNRDGTYFANKAMDRLKEAWMVSTMREGLTSKDKKGSEK